MFEIQFTDNYEKEIHIKGDTDLVRQLYNILDKETQIFGYTESCRSNPPNIREHAEFDIGLWNLKGPVGRSSVAQLFLNFIETNKIKIDERTSYILHFWIFELEMINQGKSYRSKYPITSRELISPKQLNLVLDKCKENDNQPLFQDLFNLFENSKRMEQVGKTGQPLSPYEWETDSFAASKEARAKYNRTSYAQEQGGNLFFKRPVAGNPSLPKAIFPMDSETLNDFN
ncbi:hypothetical protein [Legionella sp. 16cNR16C]|uniref:hypothetical protein n=1 Tax=Legionella sp. 16cNR16C TaxID=2905656 RepID=UPI001E390EB3|nr:hypothetical protein [Legionella sp. 16cNR16C]MCE3046386.1 hypothetical protein [Legionella sp. 16cNR16C]